MSLLAEVQSSTVPFWGRIDSNSYRILFTVHIMAIIATFGPLFLSSPLNREAIKRSGDEAKGFAEVPLTAIKTMSFPAFIVAVIAGMLLVADSGKFYSFDQSWLSIAFSIVLALALVYWFLLIPAQKRMTAAVQEGTAESHETDSAVRSAKASAAMATGLMHLGMLALIIVMIWKPGL